YVRARMRDVVFFYINACISNAGAVTHDDVVVAWTWRANRSGVGTGYFAIVAEPSDGTLGSLNLCFDRKTCITSGRITFNPSGRFHARLFELAMATGYFRFKCYLRIEILNYNLFRVRGGFTADPRDHRYADRPGLIE